MSLKAAFLQNFASPIAIAVGGGLLVGTVALFKGDEISENVKSVKTTITNFSQFSNASANKAPQDKVDVQPVAKTASNPAGLAEWKDVQPK